MHVQQHPLAGEMVVLTNVEDPQGSIQNGDTLVVEDWWDRVSGVSWMLSVGNPAALNFAFRSGAVGLPIDDEVVYGKINGLGYLVHVTEF